MANKQISQLTQKPTPVAATDQFGIDDNASATWKITVTNLQTYFTALYLTLSGGTMTGNLTLNGNPTTNLMAATKQYVDNLAAGLNVQPSCVVASTAALTVTYNNGTSGVGATLTNAGAQAALSIDGVTLALNDRVLVKNQASTFQNGIYTATNLGSGSTNWVLTRATDYDTAAEITPGDFVLIVSGTSNAQSQWMQTATVVTVGTDAIVWDQFGADITGIIAAIQNNAYVYSADTGSADAYLATLSPALAAYTAGSMVILNVANANTGAATINVNGLGVKNIVTEQNGTLQAGDLIAGRRAWLLYDGTSFRLVNRNIENRIQNDSFNYILDTGAADAYVATLVPAVTAYVAGQRLSLKIANTNTGAATVNVNGLGVKNIKTQNGNNPLAGDILAGTIMDLRYDGTNFIMVNRNQPIRIQNESYNYLLETGAADAYVATMVPTVAAYVAGQRFSLKIANTNTTASTLNVNGLGAKSIKRIDGTALVAGDLIAGMIADFRYDGTNFQLLNPARRLLGTSTNNNAVAGYAGEFVSSIIPYVSAVSLTTGVKTNITSISLTAGDWDVEGNVFFESSTQVGTGFYAWTSSTSAVLNDPSLLAAYYPQIPNVFQIGLLAPKRRYSLSSTTTIYLEGQGIFASGTMIACGNIEARRQPT